MRKQLTILFTLLYCGVFGQSDVRHKNVRIDGIANYKTDQSSNYGSRSLVDSAFVGGALGSALTNLKDQTTDSLSEGNTNFYYSDSLFNVTFGGKTTDSLPEGSNNQYFTNTRARNAISADPASVITYDAGTGVIGSDLDTLIVDSVFQLKRGATNGYLLTTDGNGFATWQPQSSTNIYTDDDTISGNRIVELNSNNINFNGGDFGINSTPAARLHIKGANDLSTSDALLVENNSGTDLFLIQNDGQVGIGTTTLGGRLQVKGAGSTDATQSINVVNSSNDDMLSLRDDTRLHLGNSPYYAFTFNIRTTGFASQILGSTGSSSSITLDAANGDGIGSDFLVIKHDQATLDGILELGASAAALLKIQNGAFGISFDQSGAVIGGSPGTPNASAALEILSTTRGFKPPVMNAAEASAIAGVDGLMLYVTDTDATFTQVGFWGYVNGTWTALH